MSTSQDSQERRRPFLVRLFLALIRLILLVVIIGGGVALGLYLFGQISSLNLRVTEQENRVDRVSRELQDFIGAQPEAEQIQGQLGRIEENLDAVESTLDTLERENSEQSLTLEAQADSLTETESNLASLSESVANLESSIEAQEVAASANRTSVESLEDSVATLNALTQDVGQLEEQLGTLNDSIGVVQSSLAGISTAAEDDVPLQSILGTMRLWTLLTRAQLALAEGDTDLASSTLTTINSALGNLISIAPATLADALDPVQTRVDAAVSALPDEPELARSNIDSAWNLLDELMAQSLGLPAEAVTAEETPTPDSDEEGNTDESDSGEDSSGDTTSGEGEGDEEEEGDGTVLPVPTATPEG